jgi:hypothetical protein
MGSFQSKRNNEVEVEESNKNDTDDFFIVRKKVFTIEDYLINLKSPNILPTIYEDEKEYKDYDVDFMENYQKQKLDDVCGI